MCCVCAGMWQIMQSIVNSSFPYALSTSLPPGPRHSVCCTEKIAANRRRFIIYKHLVKAKCMFWYCTTFCVATKRSRRHRRSAVTLPIGELGVHVFHRQTGVLCLWAARYIRVFLRICAKRGSFGFSFSMPHSGSESAVAAAATFAVAAENSAFICLECVCVRACLTSVYGHVRDVIAQRVPVRAYL